MTSEEKQPDKRAGKERLAFTIYNILKELDPNKKGFVSVTRFNKVSYLVHKELKERFGINTSLPWHWYLYGPVTELAECPPETYQLVGLGDEQRVFFGRAPSAKHVSEHEKKEILNVIESWRDKYLKTPDLVDLTYDDLEIGFLKELKSLDKLLAIRDIEVRKEKILTTLDAIRNSYSEEQYEDSFSVFLRLDEMVRVIIESDPDYLFLNHWMVTDFRTAIVQKAAANNFENLTDEWKGYQIGKYRSLLEEFTKRLSEVEQEIYTKVYKKTEDSHGYARKLMEVSWDSCWEE